MVRPSHPSNTGPEVLDLRKAPPRWEPRPPRSAGLEPLRPGSNSWAVAQETSASPAVPCWPTTCTSPLMAPGMWYRVRFSTREATY